MQCLATFLDFQNFVWNEASMLKNSVFWHSSSFRTYTILEFFKHILNYLWPITVEYTVEHIEWIPRRLTKSEIFHWVQSAKKNIPLFSCNKMMSSAYLAWTVGISDACSEKSIPDAHFVTFVNSQAIWFLPLSEVSRAKAFCRSPTAFPYMCKPSRTLPLLYHAWRKNNEIVLKNWRN